MPAYGLRQLETSENQAGTEELKAALGPLVQTGAEGVDPVVQRNLEDFERMMPGFKKRFVGIRARWDPKVHFDPQTPKEFPFRDQIRSSLVDWVAFWLTVYSGIGASSESKIFLNLTSSLKASSLRSVRKNKYRIRIGLGEEFLRKLASPKTDPSRFTEMRLKLAVALSTETVHAADRLAREAAGFPRRRKPAKNVSPKSLQKMLLDHVRAEVVDHLSGIVAGFYPDWEAVNQAARFDFAARVLPKLESPVVTIHVAAAGISSSIATTLEKRSSQKSEKGRLLYRQRLLRAMQVMTFTSVDQRFEDVAMLAGKLSVFMKKTELVDIHQVTKKTMHSLDMFLSDLAGKPREPGEELTALITDIRKKRPAPLQKDFDRFLEILKTEQKRSHAAGAEEFQEGDRVLDPTIGFGKGTVISIQRNWIEVRFDSGETHRFDKEDAPARLERLPKGSQPENASEPSPEYSLKEIKDDFLSAWAFFKQGNYNTALMNYQTAAGGEKTLTGGDRAKLRRDLKRNGVKLSELKKWADGIVRQVPPRYQPPRLLALDLIENRFKEMRGRLDSMEAWESQAFSHAYLAENPDETGKTAVDRLTSWLASQFDSSEVMLHEYLEVRFDAEGKYQEALLNSLDHAMEQVIDELRTRFKKVAKLRKALGPLEFAGHGSPAKNML